MSAVRCRPSVLVAGWAAAVALGCAAITVKPTAAPDLPDDCWACAVQADRISPRTLLTLRRYDLADLAEVDPAEAARRLHTYALQEPQPDAIFALAELSYLRGRRAERKKEPGACDHYFRCVGYAYHYLLGPDDPRCPSGRSSPYDPQFRRACELYNAGLLKCLRAAQQAGGLDPARPDELRLPGQAGGVMTVRYVNFPWQPAEFGPLMFSGDFEVHGLAEVHRTFGLGVPLLAVRSDKAPPRPYVPAQVCFPATAFLHFDGDLADLEAGRGGRLQLLNPLKDQAIVVRDRKVPLETDLTTPMAYQLSKASLRGDEFKGFLRPEQLAARTGIYMTEPYQPGKIPVLLIHGLLSSPETWAPLFNDLQADAGLRERFQFWFYFYPTGLPYAVTAADLRDRLDVLRRDLDPARRDPALGEMVLVGHSMGGLISRMLTVDSGDDFWKLAGGDSFQNVSLKPETQAELRRIFFYGPRPEVRRVIFLGTPHHGSRLSPALPGRLATRLVRLPMDLMTLAQDVSAAEKDRPALALPTSIDMLSPDSPALTWLAGRPRPPSVAYHSVIGVTPPGVGRMDRWLAGDFSNTEGDGVVSYRSAHLDDVESELVVPADHYTVHQHPLSVMEVRRILREHARVADQRAIDLVGHQEGR